jgi:hypothetical protein
VATLMVPAASGDYVSLGNQVCDFIEACMVYGPGPLAGRPAKLDVEKRMLIHRAYELYPQGHERAGGRVFDRVAVELRKGVSKTEMAAWIALAELHPDAPVRFDGFNPDGTLRRGRAVRSPYIPMLAASEEQVAELAYGVLRFIVLNGPDADLFDASLDRIVRRGPMGRRDGVAEAISTSPNQADGSRVTFQHFDEPHRLTLPRQRAAVETMLQNLHKLELETPWALYTSTAGQPGQGSVEEDVRLEAEMVADGRKTESRLFFFGRWASTDRHPSLDTAEQRIAAVSEATGPIGPYGENQFRRIAADYTRHGIDESYWERVNLNRWLQAAASAYPVAKVRELATPGVEIPKGAFVTVGFDGAKYKDATAIVITDIQSGAQQLVGLWECPEDEQDWETDAADVDGVMSQVFRDFQVWRAYCDPPYWVEVVASWAGRWPGQVTEWRTARQFQAAAMAAAYGEAIGAGTISFGGTVQQCDDLIRHVGHAGRFELKQRDEHGQPLWRLHKLGGQDVNKFDACMAANLAWQARLDAVSSGAKPRATGIPRRIY